LDLLILPSINREYPNEVEPACIGIEGRCLESSYGFVLCLPREYDESSARRRVLTMLELIHRLKEALKSGGLRVREQLEELLARESPSLRVVEDRLGLHSRVLRVVDDATGTTVLKIEIWGDSYTPYSSSGYWLLYRKVWPNGLHSIVPRRLGERGNYAFYYIAVDLPSFNAFEELARNARYGMVAVIGNDDREVERFWIRGEKVYDLHTTLLKIGSFLIVGLEGSVSGMGPSGRYTEDDVRFRLEFARETLKRRDKLIIVSHDPPRGILDRAMRFGDRAIGSMALREFLEECPNVVLVICGHVHRCGGRHERLNNATIVNVSSHDDSFSRANIAWIVLDELGNVMEVEMLTLPSLVEHIFRRKSEEGWLKDLQERVGLSKDESKLFVQAFMKHGEKLFDDLPALAALKFRYGFSWDNVFRLYGYGIKSADHLTESVYREVLNQSPPIHRVHLMRAYAKIKREAERGEIYLMSPIHIPSDSKLVIFDMEYIYETEVLYGFLDMASGEIEQFWFDERERAIEYVDERRDRVFIHWGGSDRKFLKEKLHCDVPTLNLLYHVQISLVAPLPSTTLRDVHDTLCGPVQDEFWKKFFYEMDGFYKLMLCNRILNNPRDTSAREELLNANKADLLALQKIVTKTKIRVLPIYNARD